MISESESIWQWLAGIFASIMLAVSAWYGRRRVNTVDNLIDDVGKIKQQYVSRDEIKSELQAISGQVGTIHRRVDDIYRHILNGQNNNKNNLS